MCACFDEDIIVMLQIFTNMEIITNVAITQNKSKGQEVVIDKCVLLFHFLSFSFIVVKHK